MTALAVEEQEQRAPAATPAGAIPDVHLAGVRKAYGDRLQRLTALKDRYDPQNIFRCNANIAPSSQSAG